MEELEYVKAKRVEIQMEYLKHVKNIWIEFEGLEAEAKAKKIYNEYRSKEKYLEQIQVRLESCLEDLEFYKKKYN